MERHPFSAQERVAQARQSLQRYAQVTPPDFAAERSERLHRLLEHHYFNTLNPTYRQMLQAHGIDWQSRSARSRSWWGWLRRSGARPTPAPVGADASITDTLARLPITDKALLTAGHYETQPAVPRDEVVFAPATSGTTTGQRAFIAMTSDALWTSTIETTLWHLLLTGLDPLQAHGYLIAHFQRHEPEAQRTSGTYATFATFSRAFAEHVQLGSTQDTLAEHIAHLSAPTHWAFSAPLFFRLIASRVSQAELAQMQLQVLLWGGGAQSQQDYDQAREAFHCRYSLGYYASTEAGNMGMQLADRAPYVVPTDRIIVEIVDADGRQVAPGESGDVLITSLVHRATPIIRYRIGDRARYLGHPERDATLWGELGLVTPTGLDDPVLAAGLLRHGVFLDSITRAGGLVVGAAKVSYEDVSAFQAALAQAGTPAAAVQIAKRYAADGAPEIVVRLEAPPARHDEYRAQVRQALRQLTQLEYYFSSGELSEPVIEVMGLGEMSSGQFKVPPILDETATVMRP